MKNIILEGPDGSGKSTLSKTLVQCLGMSLQSGEGPEKFQGEILERIERYSKQDNHIFDRHPCVSHPIYSKYKPGLTKIPNHIIDNFYSSKPLFIYCYGRGHSHELKNYDTPDHIKTVIKYDEEIRDAYRWWAQDHAQIRYQIGEDLTSIINTCREFIR